jgi:hypothetical protein
MTADPTPPRSDSGSIYDGRSPAGQRALGRLRSVLLESGFIVDKERPAEATLRVYPVRRGRYPLLNPCFVPAGRDAGVLVATPAVVCEVISDHDASIADVLRRLPIAGEWTFHSAPRRPGRGRYQLHGRFVVPVPFLGDRRNQDIDFEYLRAAFGALHLELTTQLFGRVSSPSTRQPTNER